MITVALEIKYFFGGFQKKYAIWLSIIGFIACSFFQAAVFPGMVYLVIWIYYCRKEKKVLWKQLIPLVIMIIGGLISVVAPGNYVRHDSYDDSGLHFTDAIVQAFFNACVVLFGLVKKPFFWILVTISGVFGAIKLKEMKGKLNPIWYAMIIVFTLFLTCYPLALGISGIGLPNRYYFLLNIYACVMVMVWSIYIGVWVRSIGITSLDNKRKALKIGLGLIFILIIIWGICSFSKIPYFKTLVDMDGIKLCHDNWMDVYDEIGNSYEEDVVLYLQPDDIENDIIKTPGITYDAQYWENANMASYFGKKTIILLYSNL